MTGSLERGIPVSYMPRPVFCLVQSKAWRKKYRNGVRMIFSGQPARKGRLACDKAKSYLCREESGISADGYLKNRCLFEGNRVGGTGLIPVPTSHTTVRAVRHTAVP